MKVKYKKEKYDVKIKDAIKIEKRKLLLLLRRIKRFGLRIINVFKKDLIILFVSIILYVLIVCIVECNFMDKTISKVMWETKEEVFTVFIVVAMNSIIGFERRWRQTIRNWHDIYADNLYCFENDIDDIFKFSGISINKDYNMLYTREFFNRFENEIRDIKIEKNRINIAKINNTLEKIRNEADELKEEVYKNDFIDNKEEFIWEYRSLKNHTYKLQEMLEDENIDIKKQLIYIINNIYMIISFIRRTWRTEINLDREIINILKIDNKRIIDNSFYLKALIYKYEKDN